MTVIYGWTMNKSITWLIITSSARKDNDIRRTFLEDRHDSKIFVDMKLKK